jgi:multidrug efflux system membrane fusion protein
MTQTIQPPYRPARPRRTWRTLVGVVLVVAAAIAIALLLARCAAGNSQGGGGAAGARSRLSITVGTATATLGDVPITVTALGTVTPEATVSVISRVTGQLNLVRFTEGQMVQKGSVLAEIEPAPYAAALAQAKGTLAHDEATLAGAQIDLKRYQTLVAQNSIAKQTAEDQAATVQTDQGQVLADKAAVSAAQINLTWTKILSPVAGRVGLRQIDAGNQVTANGATPIAVVTQIDPIDVIFAISEDAIPSIVRHPGFGAGLPVQAFDRTGGAAIANGSLATIDNVVDTTTGTVKGKARFANPTGALFPNQFVNITVLVDTLKNQVIVPTTAIRHGPSSDFVWLLQSDNTVTQRTVKTGPGTGETTSVTSGLNAGETVITDGGDRLREGAPVTLPHSHAGTGAGSGGGKGSGHHKGGGANTNSTNTNSTNSTGGGAGGMGMFGGAG